MAKWADYLISEVKHSSDPSVIDRVKVHEEHDNQIGIGVCYTRDWVINKIENEGKSVCTITSARPDKWQMGAMVEVIEVNGNKFIRTDKNQIEKDNLGELPNCN